MPGIMSKHHMLTQEKLRETSVYSREVYSSLYEHWMLELGVEDSSDLYLTLEAIGSGKVNPGRIRDWFSTKKNWDLALLHQILEETLMRFTLDYQQSSEAQEVRGWMDDGAIEFLCTHAWEWIQKDSRYKDYNASINLPVWLGALCHSLVVSKGVLSTPKPSSNKLADALVSNCNDRLKFHMAAQLETERRLLDVAKSFVPKGGT